MFTKCILYRLLGGCLYLLYMKKSSIFGQSYEVPYQSYTVESIRHMNTKYHIFQSPEKDNRVIVWDKVAGTDFEGQDIRDGAFLSTAAYKWDTIPYLIFFNLNIVSGTPFLQVRLPEETGIGSGHDLVFHFSDGTAHTMTSEAAWYGSHVLYILAFEDLKALSEKMVDHYCFHGLVGSFMGDMSSSGNLRIARLNQYDKETGAQLFREYVCDYISILRDEFGIELQPEDNSTSTSQEKASDDTVQTEPLSFKGIPIGGPIDDMVKALEGVGFTHAFEEDGNAILTGSFATEKECMLVVKTSPITGEVESVMMGGDHSSSWSVLKDKYFNYKKLLTKKYGTPESTEGFQFPYYDGCGDESLAIESGDCVYWSTFKVKGQGEIKLAILPTQVMILYQNGFTQEEEIDWDSAMDDL